MATCTTGVERKPFKYFVLALLGYNAKLTRYGFEQFVKNNEEQIWKVNMRDLISFFKDGTQVIGLLSADDRIRGYRFDQLILFDDNRWEIERHREEDIEIIKALTMQLSNVPEKFQILKYEDMR